MEEKKNRDDKGRFLPGNTEGFKPGNTLNSLYNEKIPQKMLSYYNNSDEAYPTLEGFAIKEKIAIRTLERWVNSPENYPCLADIYAQCKAIQLNKLLIGGLTKRFDAQIVKFIAINNHGMKEKVESDVKADAEIKVKIDFFEDDTEDGEDPDV